MKNFLKDFVEMSDARRHTMIDQPGPVVTISRETGCSTNYIAMKLSKILSGYGYQKGSKQSSDWKFVNKEVIEHAAVELEMSPDEVKNVFLKEVRTHLHDVSMAFSTEKVYDADDQRVIDTVKDVITQLAGEGRCVIVGRAANIITSGIEARLSVKIQAPLEWRIRRIMNLSSMSYADARDYVLEIDRQRMLYIEHIAGRHVDDNDYDMVFNHATLSDDQIVDAMLHVMKSKQLIQ